MGFTVDVSSSAERCSPLNKFMQPHSTSLEYWKGNLRAVLGMKCLLLYSSKYSLLCVNMLNMYKFQSYQLKRKKMVILTANTSISYAECRSVFELLTIPVTPYAHVIYQVYSLTNSRVPLSRNLLNRHSGQNATRHSSSSQF